MIIDAENNRVSYLEFINNIFKTEIDHRAEKDKERRARQARLPLSYDLDLYDFTNDNGLEKQQLNQLRELSWLEQNFNVILMGPSGTGKPISQQACVSMPLNKATGHTLKAWKN